MEKELVRLRQDLETTSHEHKTFKKGATNYSGLQEAHKKFSLELAKLQADLEVAQRAYDKLQSSSSMRWFLCGAGFIVFGWLLGFMISGRRRKRPTELHR